MPSARVLRKIHLHILEMMEFCRLCVLVVCALKNIGHLRLAEQSCSERKCHRDAETFEQKFFS